MRDFATNKALREMVKEYILNVFREQAVEKVFSREDVTHIADAAELVEAAFVKMEVEFTPQKDTIKINEAR